MKIIRAISDTLSVAERWLVVLLLGIIITLSFTQVVLRNLFSAGFLWADPFLRHLVLWIGLLGASLATQQGKHINLDIVTRFAPKRYLRISGAVTEIFALIVTLMLAKAGVTFVQNEYQASEILITIGPFSLPTWWFQLILPAGFGLMAFRFLIRAVENIYRIFHLSPRTGNGANRSPEK